MPGPNQHHIPVFLQKGFAIPKTRAKRIWVWERGSEPREGIIKKTGSKDQFYNQSTDDRITELETPLAVRLRAIRDLPVGTKANPEHAAECVMHFASRTAHLRGTMEVGLKQLSRNAASLFDDPDLLANMVGLNKTKPSTQFTGHLWDAIRKHVDLASLPIPGDVLERMAFAVAREQFTETLEQALPSFNELFAMMVHQSPELARDGHSKAVDDVLKGERNPRFDQLAQLEWYVLQGPAEGAILPHCVVLALANDERHGPYLHNDRENTQAVVMPISTEKVLVGVEIGSALPDLSDINRVSAASSHEFFLSSSTDTGIKQLHPYLGSRFAEFIDEAISEAFKNYLAPSDASKYLDEVPAAFTGSPPNWSYEMRLDGWGDSEFAEASAERLRSIVGPMSQILPLQRMEAMVFAFDYALALTAIDRGIEGIAPTETIDNQVGKGVAKTLTVRREEGVRAVVVCDAIVLYHLMEGNSADADWALRIIIHQLALVAMLEWTERALPGVQLQRIPGSELDVWLYGHADAAINAYVASHVSAGFGDKEETTSLYRKLLIAAVGQIDTTIVPARLEYRTDGDLDKFIATALPIVRLILMFAADLLGHCKGSGDVLFDEEGELENALRLHGLEKWLSVLGADLEKVRTRLAEWTSFDEFMELNIHVERLLWQVGMIPWLKDGRLWMEVPLQIDAEKLASMTDD
jgi:hypothetical protein